jgi:hypothetical protein
MPFPLDSAKEKSTLKATGLSTLKKSMVESW